VKKDPRVYLAHILECAQKIQRYTKGGQKSFLEETMTQDAVIRNFESWVRQLSACLKHTGGVTLRFRGV
jgi:hypothetical protein